MAMPNIELYEALKKDISDEAARMIAEVVPPLGELSTRADLSEAVLSLRSDLNEAALSLRSDLNEAVLSLRSDLSEAVLSLRSDLNEAVAALALSMEKRFAAVDQRIAAAERRFMALQMALILPLWGALVAAAVKLVIRI